LRKEEIIAGCIDEIQAERSTLEEALMRYPEYADELRSLLRIANNIQPEKAVPTVNFKQHARLRLINQMAQSAARPEQVTTGWLKPLVLKPGIPFVIVIVILALIVGGGATAYASQGSLPDDMLYPVKTTMEDLQLALTRSPEARATLHLRLAQRRLNEAVAEASLGRDISKSSLEEIASELDAAIRELNSVLPEETKDILSQLSAVTIEQQGQLGQLLVTAPESQQPILEDAIDAGRRDLIAKVGYGNPAVLGSMPSVMDRDIESAYFELQGLLLGVENSTWNIDGILITNVNSALGTPETGRWVEIEGMVHGGQTFISEIEYEDDEKGWVKIKGVFGGTGQNGTIWYIGGIAVNMSQEIIAPAEGQQVELKGTISNGVFTTVDMISEDEDEEEAEDRERESVEVDGVLVGIDRSNNNILVEVLRSQITIDISAAEIKGEDKQLLSVSDLELLVGQDIKVTGFYNAEGIFSAVTVFVDVEMEDDIEEAEEYEEEDEAEDDEEESDGNEFDEEESDDDEFDEEEDEDD